MRQQLHWALLIVAVAAFLPGCERREYTAAFTLTSPGQRYTVDVFGPLGIPTWPGIEYQVRVTARRGALVLTERHSIHFADWFDEAFTDDYGAGTWVAENVVRFPTTWRTKRPNDFVRVENRTEHPIAFLTIVCGDLLLMFELPPASVTETPVTAQRDWSGQSWVFAEGEWSSGRNLQSRGMNFDMTAVPRAYRYMVTVRDAGVQLSQVSMP